VASELVKLAGAADWSLVEGFLLSVAFETVSFVGSSNPGMTMSAFFF
jgi:hypothetical protein